MEPHPPHPPVGRRSVARRVGWSWRRANGCSWVTAGCLGLRPATTHCPGWFSRLVGSVPPEAAVLRPREAGARRQQRAPRSRIPGSALSRAGRQAGRQAGVRGEGEEVGRGRRALLWVGWLQTGVSGTLGRTLGVPPVGSALWGWQVAERGGGDLGTGAGRRRAVKVRKVAAEGGGRAAEEPGRLGGRWVPRSGVVGRGGRECLRARGCGQRAEGGRHGWPVGAGSLWECHVWAGKAGSRSRRLESRSGQRRVARRLRGWTGRAKKACLSGVGFEPTPPGETAT